MRCKKCGKRQTKLKKGIIVFEGLTERPTAIRICEKCGWPVFERGYGDHEPNKRDG